MDAESVMTEQDILAFTKCGDLALIFFLDKNTQPVILIIMNNTQSQTKLASFEDLEFKPHGGFAEGKATQATLTFGHRNKDNQDQFTISVVQNQGDGTGLYGHEDDNTYEVAMWYQDRDTMLPLAKYDDVLAGQSPVDVTKLMHQAQLNDFAWVTLLHSLRSEHRKEMGLD